MNNTAPPTPYVQYTQEEWDWALALARAFFAPAPPVEPAPAPAPPVEHVDTILSVDLLVKSLESPPLPSYEEEPS